MFAVAHVNIHSQLIEQNEIEQSESYYREQYEQAQLLSQNVYGWIEDIEIKTRLQTDVNPEDSVSQTSLPARSATSKQSGYSTSSSAKIRLIEEAANRMALEAKLELLHEKQALAERRLQLQKERDEEYMRLQQAEERLTVESELAQCVAREQVFVKAEAAERGMSSNVNTPLSRSRSMNLKASIKRDEGKSESGALDNSLLKTGNKAYEDNSRKMHKEQLTNPVKTRQSHSLTLDDLFVQQQMNAMALALPKPNVPSFGGNAMEYCNFIRAFENIIEANTESLSARLYYLVQYTTGEVQELMRSCLAMAPDEGYIEARTLLKKRYGQNYRIATSLCRETHERSSYQEGRRRSTAMIFCPVNVVHEYA